MLEYNKEGAIVISHGVLELLIPEVYSSRGGFVRKGEYYDLFFVAMGRHYPTVEDYKAKKGTLKYKPITLPYMISTKPTDVENDIVELPKGGSDKKVYRLIYYKGDILSKNSEYIKSSDNTQRIYNIIDDGKGDFLTYTAIAKVLEETHTYNGTNLPVPMEAIEAITAEKSRDPNNYNKPARWMESVPEAVQTLAPRENMMTSSSFNIFGFEDINTGILVMANKKEKGIVDSASTLEKIITGNLNP